MDEHEDGARVRTQKQIGKAITQLAPQRLAMQYEVSCLLIQASSLAEIAPQLVEVIGRGLTGVVSILWLLDTEEPVLHCEAIWQEEMPALNEFTQLTRYIRFPRGVGLPGRVWTNKAPIWWANALEERDFLRYDIAQRVNLHGALAFPLQSQGEFQGVIEVFRHEHWQPDEELLQTILTLGYQLGQYLEGQRTREAIRASELRKAAILHTALDAIVTINHLGNILEWNPAAERLFGYRRADALGKDMASLIVPPSLREQHRQGLQHYLRTGKAHVLDQRLEVTALNAEGNEFPVELTITRIPLDGPPVFTAYLRDLTQHHRIEEERRQLLIREQVARRQTAIQADQMTAIFEAIADLVLVYDAQGTLIRTNAAIQGIEFLTWQGSTLQERQHSRYLHDEQGRPMAIGRWPLERILQGEKLMGANAVDVQVLHPDGKYIQLNVTGSTIRNEQGEIQGAVLICRDVTQRRQLERRTQEALSALLTMAQELIEIPADVHTRSASEDASQEVAQRLVEVVRSVIGCQRVSLTALDARSGEMRSLAAIGISKEQEQQWKERRDGMTLGQLVATPDVVDRLQASEVVVLDFREAPWNMHPNTYGISTMLLAPMQIENQLIGVLSLDFGGEHHTYTEEERVLAGAIARLAALVIERERLLQEQAAAQATVMALQDSKQRMDEFLSIASHEMNTPLTGIKGNIQLAQRLLKQGVPEDTLQLTEQQLRYLQIAGQRLESLTDQVRRLTLLIRDILDVSRGQNSQLSMHKTRVDLVKLVQASVAEQRAQWPERTILLEEPDEQAIYVEADADRLMQVLTNYLTNALKYAPAELPIRVGTECQNEQVRVWVRDQGPGIALEEQAHIWERFYRVEGIETIDSHVGLGLGLYLCRQIIEWHGGTVGVKTAPGAGSTFWFTLPLL